MHRGPEKRKEYENRTDPPSESVLASSCVSLPSIATSLFLFCLSFLDSHVPILVLIRPIYIVSIGVPSRVLITLEEK